MSYTVSKIIDAIVCENYYPTHSQIVSWANSQNSITKEYETITNAMAEHNLCTITSRVEEVRQKNFYTSPIYGSGGRTITLEDPMPGILLSQRHLSDDVHIKNPSGTQFAQIVAQRFSGQITERLQEKQRIQTQREEEARATSTRIANESAIRWQREMREAADNRKEAVLREERKQRMLSMYRYQTRNLPRLEIPTTFTLDKPTPRIDHYELLKQCQQYQLTLPQTPFFLNGSVAEDKEECSCSPCTIL